MPDSAAAKVTWPQPKHFAAAALAWSLFVAYGSLTPFHIQPLESGQAWRMLWTAIQQPLQATSRGDWITNFLLLTPWGFAGLGALLVDRDRPLRRGVGIGIVLAVGFVLSIAVEGAQIWFPPRHPSKTDVLAQTLGNVVGMGLWILAGQTLTEWTRRHLHGPRAGQAAWLLRIYTAGLIFLSLLPLDLTIRLSDLWAKYKAGMVNLIPFSHWRWDAPTLCGAVLGAAAFWPVGMLAALWPARDGGRGQSIVRRWLAGVALVGLIEFVQLFVRSRYSDTTDLIVGAVGVSGGLAVAQTWSRVSGGRSRLGVVLRAACLIGFTLLLVAIYLAPFDLAADRGEVRQRLADMVRVPMETLRQGEPLAMIANVLRKLLLFGTLGWLASEQAISLAPQASARWLIATGLIAGLLTASGIEIAQAWFPPHVPDVTDIAWGALGGGLGAYAGRFVAAVEKTQ